VRFEEAKFKRKVQPIIWKTTNTAYITLLNKMVLSLIIKNITSYRHDIHIYVCNPNNVNKEIWNTYVMLFLYILIGKAERKNFGLL
jgi:hypothetical protein